MNTKNLLVSLMMLVGAMFFIASVSAAPLATVTNVEVDGLAVASTPAIVVGNSVNIRVDFSSLVNISDVTVKATLEGNKKDVVSQTSSFDVETGQSYSRVLKLDVPFDLKDKLSDTATLRVRIKGAGGFSTETVYTLRVQRNSYSADIISVSVPQTVKAGELIPVDVVVKNLGYNNLNNLFVTAGITGLNVERTSFFGDIVAVECDKTSTSVQNYNVNITRKCNEDVKDTASGRLFVQIPYDAKSGVYSLNVKAGNEDSASSKTVQITVDNAFSLGNFIVSGNQLLVVNPTNEVVVYRLIPQSANGVSVSVSDNVVAVPAGSSKSVTVDATSSVAGTQTYAVGVYSADGKLLDTVNFNTVSSAKNASSPVIVLTVILAIIFVILLVVLMVLIGKKPEKEEFGESYY